MAIEKVVRYKAVCGACGVELGECVSQAQAYHCAYARDWHVYKGFNYLGELIVVCTCTDCLREE